MKTTLSFFKESIRNLRTTGAVVRSSKYLVREMLKPIDFSQARVVVELGAGDGVMTFEILKNLHPKARLLCFEINAQFCEMLREIQDERFVLIEDSAEKLGDYMRQLEINEVDYVVSAIPFVALSDELSYAIVQGCFTALKKKGLYIQFHYSTLIKKMYKKIFGNIDINFVALNIPPAFVMICEKN